ncbi:conserved hypothetical protein [Gammaproteobacteria bacterium]
MIVINNSGAAFANDGSVGALGGAAGLGSLGMLGLIGGGITSAIGSYFTADSQKTLLDSQAAIAEVNARIAELGAQSALYQGQQQVAELTLKAGKLKSSQRVAMAANGIDLGVGSAAEVQASTDLMKEIDKNTLEQNAVRAAWGYRTQGVNYRNDALMKRAGADSINPLVSATSSLLGSTGNVASSWYVLNRMGALDGSMVSRGG